MNKRQLKEYECTVRGPCFCPSCGKDFMAGVICTNYDYPFIGGPAAIICDDCVDSPLAKSIKKILND